MASTYLTRTFGSTGNRKTFTISVWVKRSSTGENNYIFDCPTSSNHDNSFRISSSDQFGFGLWNGSDVTQVVTNAKLRDCNGFYHLVASVDTTQATASDRVKLYINGELQTSLSSSSYPSQNYDYYINQNITHYIGYKQPDNARYFNGSMSHFHFIDGTAYDASAFGQADANGVWTIKTSPSVTYGNNGFFILKDGNSVTDQSGNGNNWTVGGGTLTNTEDNPSNVFATGNPLYKWNYNLSSTNGNTSFSGSTTQWQGMSSTLGISSGKYYYEAKFTSATNITDWVIGFMGLEDYNLTNATRNLVGFYNFDGGEIWTADAVNNTATTNDYGTFSNGDIMGVALDYDNETITIYKNGTALVTDFDYGAVGTSTTLKGGKAITPVFVNYGSGGGLSVNFGNGYFGTTAVASAGTNASGIGIFEYDVPTGYTALSTKGLNL